ncbi:acyl-CoA thioesterase [Caldimonas brevitalea]|uniref:Acyl-CoA thioesterase n=1 Tax=Caldimonas brevitalea TaxID=413882 RepID=A0A0G3BLI9_9BURK|nr:thioesterase family protein [Caldimonas brevitalea]AKJ30294.1 acyl-CoA thioesterase [Caldimonas brevitalea]
MDTRLPLSQLLAGRSLQGSTVSFGITDDWLQGRTTFGGLISACAVAAMREVAGAQWPTGVRLIALQTNFVGPVGLGQMDVEVQLLREGKNLRQVQAVVRQAGETAAVLLGVFGVARETALPRLAPVPPAVPVTPGDAAPLPYIAGMTPNFTQHLDFRWAEGHLPFSGQDTWQARVYARLKDDKVDDELLTVLLADAAPTAAISRLTTRVPSSSVSWALELAAPSRAGTGDGYWRIDKDTRAAAGGYVNDTTTLWTPNGELAAFGYQVVAVYG